MAGHHRKSHKELKSKIQLDKDKSQWKWTKDLNRHFSRDVKMARKLDIATHEENANQNHGLSPTGAATPAN